MAEILIAFYSRADENYMNGELKILDIGNTEVAAGMIKVSNYSLTQKAITSVLQKRRLTRSATLVRH